MGSNPQDSVTKTYISMIASFMVRLTRIEYNGEIFVESGIRDDSEPFRDVKIVTVLWGKNFIKKIKKL
jgi:hypothetical protein